MYRYFLIVIACIAVLLGIQIPNFVDQYEKRLDAHFIEVKNNLRGYQEIADKYYGGSVEALIRKHESSEDPTFKDEARPIENIYARFLRFSAQKAGLATDLAGKVAFLFTDRDRELMEEVSQNYSFTIPLDRQAVVAGFLFAAVVLLAVELLLALLRLLLRPQRRKFDGAPVR